MHLLFISPPLISILEDWALWSVSVADCLWIPDGFGQWKHGQKGRSWKIYPSRSLLLDSASQWLLCSVGSPFPHLQIPFWTWEWLTDPWRFSSSLGKGVSGSSFLVALRAGRLTTFSPCKSVQASETQSYIKLSLIPPLSSSLSFQDLDSKHIMYGEGKLHSVSWWPIRVIW